MNEVPRFCATVQRVRWDMTFPAREWLTWLYIVTKAPSLGGIAR